MAQFSEFSGGRMPTGPVCVAVEPPQAELRSYTPTWREQAIYSILGDHARQDRRDVVEGFLGKPGADPGMSLSDFTPFQYAFNGEEAARAFQRGDWVRGTTSLISMLPMGAVAGMAVRNGARVLKKVIPSAVQGSAVNPVRAAYPGVYKPFDVIAREAPARAAPQSTFVNEASDVTRGQLSKASAKAMPLDPPQIQRAFIHDYLPDAAVDGAGRLLLDVEGRPLVAEHVVGRRSLNGPDVALTRPEIEAVATTFLDHPPIEVTAQKLGPGNRGAYLVDKTPDGGFTRRIWLRERMSAPERARTLAHESGHLFDDIAGPALTKDGFRFIPQRGLERELRQLYQTLNLKDPAKKYEGLGLGPELYGYPEKEHAGELMAEFIRTYLTSPAYAKWKAPDAARLLRRLVNSNPRISPIIQFNSLLGGAYLADKALQNELHGTLPSDESVAYGLGPNT